MRKLYTGLVSTKPPKELPSGDKPYGEALQEISSSDPTIMVPQGDTDYDDRVRAMLLHDAALTPASLDGAYGIPAWALDTARLIRASQVAGLSQNKQYCDLPDNDNKAFSEALGPYSGNHTQYRAALTRLALATGIKGLGDVDTLPKLNTWEEVVDYAKALNSQAKRNGEMPIPAPSKSAAGLGDDNDGEGEGEGPCDDDNDYSKEGQGGAKASGDRVKSPTGESTYADFLGDPWHKGTVPKPSAGARAPGKLVNADAPDQLTMVNRRAKRGLRRRAELCGMVPRAIHRHIIDGKVFRGFPNRKGGAKGRGTILVDMSGSMSWSEADFEHMLKVLPECTVLGYCGHAGKGRWVLLGDRGRVARIADVTAWLRTKQQGNCVDVPCLRKLGMMSAPRIWLSDGCATDGGDYRTQYIIDLCAEAIVRGDIVRCRYPEDVVNYLSKGYSARAYTGARAALRDD